jgi:hypothetical protein
MATQNTGFDSGIQGTDNRWLEYFSADDGNRCDKLNSTKCHMTIARVVYWIFACTLLGFLIGLVIDAAKESSTIPGFSTIVCTEIGAIGGMVVAGIWEILVRCNVFGTLPERP